MPMVLRPTASLADQPQEIIDSPGEIWQTEKKE